MRCLSCNCALSDREANRKFNNWEEIKNPESRYIMLCDDCMLDTDLTFIENPELDDSENADDYEQLDFQPDIIQLNNEEM